MADAPEAPAAPQPPSAGLVVGPDGLSRCAWVGSVPAAVGYRDYVEYHDEEWGRPVRTEVGLFERVTLEAFQSGLSWLTILRKRAAFRVAFAGFDPRVVAGYGPSDVERLLADAGIVRNRAKIEASIANAKATVALDGELPALIWSFAPTEERSAPRLIADVPAITPESVALAKGLRREGFRFVGPTTAYALMQAAGLVNDHLEGCIARSPGLTGH